MRGPPPPLFLRTTVLVGAACLALGVAGTIVAALSTEEGMSARIRVVGIEAGADLTIEAAWTEGDVTVRETARPTGEAATWELANPPRGEPIRLRIARSPVAEPLFDGIVSVPDAGPITVRLD